MSRARFGNQIFTRGLIEISSFCKNNCRYCGIRRGNPNAQRYRLSEEEILCCCDMGERLGYKTFVLQGGEDAFFTDGRLIPLIQEIKRRHPDCALTLSLGERSRRAIRRCLTPGPTGIFCATRPRIPSCTGRCIPRNWTGKTGCAACTI